MTLGDNQSISYSYDALKRLTTKTVKSGSTTVLKHAHAYKNSSATDTVITTTPLVEFQKTGDGSLS